MNTLAIALRTVHFAAAIALFGEFAFLFWVAHPAFRSAAKSIQDDRIAFQHRLVRFTGWSLALAIISGAGWLGVYAATASGAPLESALARETLATILDKTTFGRVWQIRLGLALGLGAMLLWLRRIGDGRRAKIPAAFCGLFAAALLASLAWVGHAAAERGADRAIHLFADAAHLLAAGSWLGALPALTYLLLRARRAGSVEALEFAAHLARRFSTLGVASVGALLLTGIANAWYTVGSVPHLLGTGYGKLLLVKLLFFAAMTTLAAINRLRLTPRISPASGSARKAAAHALGSLFRNAVAETALGLAAVGVVGALGITRPAVHGQPVWPFAWTLSWQAVEESPGALFAVLFAGTVAFVAVGVAVVVAVGVSLLGISFNRKHVLAVGASMSAAAAVVCAAALAVPAVPTTYFRSPVRYTAASIIGGQVRYRQHCTVCHGDGGRGNGPAARTLAVPSADLTAHLDHHSDGDLYWWITRGRPGTPMPGFGSLMGEADVWATINFLRAQAEAEKAKTMRPRIEPTRPIVAPDFTFQIGRGVQESLSGQRGRHDVLLVFYTLPRSSPRLNALAEWKSSLERVGLRIIALPESEPQAASADENAERSALEFARSDPGVAAAYAIFQRTAMAERSSPAPHHMEFMIDRRGYLRARWLPQDRGAWPSAMELVRLVELVKLKPPGAPIPYRHAH